MEGDSLSNRAKIMTNASELLLKNIETYSRTISLEMGKPISESRVEIKKCAWVCDYYARECGKISCK